MAAANFLKNLELPDRRDLLVRGSAYRSIIMRTLAPRASRANGFISMSMPGSRKLPRSYGGGRSDICGQTFSHGFVGIDTSARD
jgi:hypothetical protein